VRVHKGAFRNSGMRGYRSSFYDRRTAKRRTGARAWGIRVGCSGKAKGRSPVGPWPVNASDRQDRGPALRWGEVVHPIRPKTRPKTFARNHTIPQKVTDVSICDKGPEPGSRELRPYDRNRCAEHRLAYDTCGRDIVPASPEVDMVAPLTALRNAQPANVKAARIRMGKREKTARPGAL
jgi:hypothetical protein